MQANYAGDGESPSEPQMGFIQSGSTQLKGLKPGPWNVSLRRAGPGGGGGALPEPIVVDVVARRSA